MKPKLLFVDDENDVLRGLKRSLRSKRSEWDMRFANSGALALEMMESDPADIVVTDMRMPEMDGAALLNTIAENWPFTRRFVLSGQADSAAVRSIVGTSHQFMGKPFDSQSLVDLLERQLEGEESEQASRILAIHALPSLEHTLCRVQKILKDENATTDEAAMVIGDDIALSAKMIQLSNSAYFGTGHATLKPGDAVRTLGRELLGSLLPETGFVEPIRRHETYHANVTTLLAFGAFAARLADKIIEQHPDAASDPVLFRQLCKFLPLGRLLGYLTGAKHYMDGELCLGFAELWGFPEALINGLAEVWGTRPLSQDSVLATAVAGLLPGIADLPPSKDARVGEWQTKLAPLAPELEAVA